MIYAKWVSQSLKKNHEEKRKRLEQFIVDHCESPRTEKDKASIEQQIVLLDIIFSSDQMGDAWHSLVQASKKKLEKMNKYWASIGKPLKQALNNQKIEAENYAYYTLGEVVEDFLTGKWKALENFDNYLKIPKSQRSNLSKKILEACQDIRAAVGELGISAGFESLVSNADFPSVGLDENASEYDALERLDLSRIAGRCEQKYYEWESWLDFDENKDYDTLASLEHGEAYETLDKEAFEEYIVACQMRSKPPSLKVEDLNAMLQQIGPDIKLFQTMTSRIESGLIERFLKYLEHQARNTIELPDLIPRPNYKANEKNLFAFRFSSYLKNKFDARLWGVVAAVTNIFFDSALDAKDVARQVKDMEAR